MSTAYNCVGLDYKVTRPETSHDYLKHMKEIVYDKIVFDINTNEIYYRDHVNKMNMDAYFQHNEHVTMKVK